MRPADSREPRNDSPRPSTCAEARPETEPDPSDWPSWSSWWDDQEPQLAEDFEGWARWSRERDRRRDEAERGTELLLRYTHVRMTVERTGLQGEALLQELCDYALSVGVCALWTDRDETANWLDLDDGIAELATRVSATDGDSYIASALDAALAVRRDGWEVTGFEHDEEPELVTARGIAAATRMSVASVYTWKRKPGFPKPVPNTRIAPERGKPAAVWPRKAVAAWLERSGRTSLGTQLARCGYQPSKSVVDRLNIRLHESHNAQTQQFGRLSPVPA